MLVSVVPCAGYGEAETERALAEVLAPLGGLNWVTPGMKVGIKANLVSALPPEAAATTHPALLCALVRMLRARGAEVIVGDSPGGLFTKAYVNRIYAAAGMKLVEEAGARLNQDFSQREAEFPAARAARHFTYTAWLDGVDALIDFCKLKSHGMMGMSAAAKNMFGVIPGIMKPEYHYRFPDIADFSDMIVDLDEYFHPRLCIADAVTGMEGNGPTAGTPRHIGALAASDSPHALDLLCAQWIGIDPSHVPTLQAAIRRGLIPDDAAQLTVAGDWAQFCIPDFQLVNQPHSLQFQRDAKGPLGRFSAQFIAKALASRPQLHADGCVGCGECARICPAKAIAMVQRRPQIDRHKCIRCFCCQEFCPKGAMQVHRPAIARLLTRGENK